ncbi:MAG: class I SAM-dependent methyltransferase [Rhodospirillales bacterium]|nr:class I SAM-dependent methyltransferase [Rhodospirillales bacterium]
MTRDHGPNQHPSPWVQRFTPLIPPGGPVLDLGAGGGRHSGFLLDAGYQVVAVDRDISGLGDLAENKGLTITEADLEEGPWPFAGSRFAGIVVVNYLHRPLLGLLTECLMTGGVLIYQTFARGNEEFGRPSNPNFLLEEGELLDVFQPSLSIVAYEHGKVDDPKIGVIQRICAVKGKGGEVRDLYPGHG